MEYLGKTAYRWLSRMSPLQQYMFALAAAGHALPNFTMYAENAGKGKLAVQLRGIAESMWRDLGGSTDEFAEDAEKSLMTLRKSVADDGTFGAEAAQNALDLMENALEASTLRSENPARVAADLSFDIIASAEATRKGEPLSDEELDESALINAERDFEIDLIRFIREKSGGPKHERLREMSDADGVSNIGISLK